MRQSKVTGELKQSPQAINRIDTPIQKSRQRWGCDWRAVLVEELRYTFGAKQGGCSMDGRRKGLRWEVARERYNL